MRLLLLLAATLGPLLIALPAAAFCRTTTCDPVTDDCQLDERGCATLGFPLRWPGQCVGWGVQAEGSPRRGISSDELRAEVQAAFDRWQSVTCDDGGTPAISLASYVELIECSDATYNRDARNANVWMFRDDLWPYVNAENAIAITTTTYSTRNGDIYDADVEINSRDKDFSIHPDGPQDRFAIDLASTVTHEAGHFLGLSHNTQDSRVTMTPGYIGFDARSLEADDIAGACSIYPASAPAPTCDFTPRHGFSTACEEPMAEPRSCALSPGGGAEGRWLGAIAGLGLLVVLGRRRARRA